MVIVDNVPDIIGVLTTLLDSLSIKTTAFTDSLKCFNYCKEKASEIECILIGYNFHHNGIAFLKSIDPFFKKRVPAILYAGFIRDSAVEEFYSLKLDAIVPLSFTRLPISLSYLEKHLTSKNG